MNLMLGKGWPDGFRFPEWELNRPKFAHRHRKRHNTTRKITYDAQHGICFYCKKPTVYANWTVDHKIPRVRGGTNRKENKVGCCDNCNRKKGFLTDSEFLGLMEKHSTSTAKHLMKKIKQDESAPKRNWLDKNC